MTAIAKSTDIEDRLAGALLRIGAVVFSPDRPFTWASGIKSPVYCDNRLTMSHPDVRRMIRDGFISVLRSQAVEPDVVVGTATAGIPHAAWLAESLNLPMAYVRSAQKGHGRENRIEGIVPSGADVVVVEDLVSTGGSSLAAVAALREAGATANLVLAIFSYQLPTVSETFTDSEVRLIPLATFPGLLRVAARQGLLGADVVTGLEVWRKQLGDQMRMETRVKTFDGP